MATIETVVCKGPDYSISLILDNTAKVFTGLHGTNNTGRQLNVVMTVQGVNRDRFLIAGADSAITLPIVRPYSDVTRGITEIAELISPDWITSV